MGNTVPLEILPQYLLCKIMSLTDEFADLLFSGLKKYFIVLYQRFDRNECDSILVLSANYYQTMFL